MIALLTAWEMRALDDFTIREVGLPGAVLMETAGRGVFEHLCRHFGALASGGHTAVVCGKGNNGGDGFVVARCLTGRGWSATAYLLGKRGEVKGDAAVHLGAYLAAGGRLVEVDEGNRSEASAEIRASSVLVDAILGTGLTADVRGLAAEAIAWVAAAGKPVVSVDIPSGVSSDTGRVCGAAVTADLTVTFAWPKRGHVLFPGAERAGRLEVVDIGIPPAAVARESPGLFALEASDFEGALSRQPDGHKGTFGHVWVFGGSGGKEGAALLAGSAALRAGAGLSTVAWPAAVSRRAAGRLPLEVMDCPLPGPFSDQGEWGGELWTAAEAAMDRADALVVGPGLGTSAGAGEFLGRLLGAPGAPVVLDADALNLLALGPEPWRAEGRGAVLTPHPGEAARLLGTTTAAVQDDRVAAARSLAERHGCAVILKGAATLVAAPGEPVCAVRAGNPGMATAGSGDVLSGVVGALLGRGLSPVGAARLAAFAHATAGDAAAARVGQEGLTATDILGALPEALRALTADRPRGRLTPQTGWEP